MSGTFSLLFSVAENEDELPLLDSDSGFSPYDNRYPVTHLTKAGACPRGTMGRLKEPNESPLILLFFVALPGSIEFHKIIGCPTGRKRFAIACARSKCCYALARSSREVCTSPRLLMSIMTSSLSAPPCSRQSNANPRQAHPSMGGQPPQQFQAVRAG
jgi:hypothetical protein